jgi:hypothetical protein
MAVGAQLSQAFEVSVAALAKILFCDVTQITALSVTLVMNSFKLSD